MSDNNVRYGSANLTRGPRYTPRAVFLVGVGGSIGTAIRYLLAETIPTLHGVPVGIFCINITGAFLLGWLITVLGRGGTDNRARRDARLFWGTGILGGFTTYSALVGDTATMLLNEAVVTGALYGLGTLVLGGVAAVLGVALGRRFPFRKSLA